MQLNVVRRISVEASTKGVTETTGQLKQLADAQGGVAASAEKQERATLSVERALEKQQRALDATYRATKQFERSQMDLDKAYKQGVLSLARYNDLTALNKQRMDQATGSTKSMSAATLELRNHASSAVSSLGSFGMVLTSFGPAGLALGAILGGVVMALGKMKSMAHDLAETAGKLVDFAETTGFTTAQLQALHKAGGMVSLDVEKINTSFERFTVSMEQLRRGSGDLYEGLTRLNPGLVDQLALTKSASQAWDILARAIAETTDQEKKNALAKAAFGRGGVGMTRLAGETTAAGGMNAMQLATSNILPDADLKRLDDLKDKIDTVAKESKKVLASIFSEGFLQQQLAYEKSWLDFANSVKNFSISGDLRYLLETILQIKLGGQGTLLGMMGIDYEAKYKAPPRDKGISVGSTSSNLGRQHPVDQMLRDEPAKEANFDDRFNATKIQNRIAVMGDAATAADKMRLAEINLGIAVKENKVTQDEANKTLTLMQKTEESTDHRKKIHALGEAATVTDLYTARINQLDLALLKQDITLETYTRAVEEAQRSFDLQRERDRIGALGDTATETERYALKVRELDKQLKTGRISQETFNRAVIAAHPLFQPLTDAAANFFDTLIKGFAQTGKMSEAFKSSLKGLGSELTSIGTKNIGQGIKTLASGGGLGGFDPVSLGIGAIGAGISMFMGRQERKKQESMAMWQRAIDQVNEANQKQQEELARIAEEQARVAEETQRKLEATRERIQAVQDRAFSATTDTSTIEGALAEFDRRAQRDRETEIREGGEAILLLEATLAVERLQIQKRFNDEAVEELKRTEEEKQRATESAARQITDYLLGLRRGADSPLSSSARLIAAQNAYNATRTLAQGGNVDALGRITQDAEAYRLAAQSRFGSGQGYQDIFNQIQQQLTALPAIQNSEDPVVLALNNIAQRQENVYFDQTATAVKSTNAIGNTQVSILSQQKTIQDAMLAAINETNRLTAAQTFNAPQSTTPTTTGPVTPVVTPEERAANREERAADQRSLNWWHTFGTTHPQYGAEVARLSARINGGEATYGPMRRGGIVGMRDGGIVGNGIFDQDSVLARHRNGGLIGLAGGEFVMPAPQAQMHMPQLEAMRQGRSANDNLVGAVESMHRTVALLLSRVVALEEQGNERIVENTQATASQTVALAREERMRERKSKAA